MIVAGRILAIERHKNADRLFVTQCDIGKEQSLQVVTNIQDLSTSQLIPIALLGHVLPAGNPIGKVKRTKLRGVESCGMFVPWDELDSTSGPTDLCQPGQVLVEDQPEPVEQPPRGHFKKVSEISNAYQLDLSDFVGQDVVVTEKMEGSSHRVGYRRGLVWCGGHNRMHVVGHKSRDDGYGFGQYVAAAGIPERLEAYCRRAGHEDLAVYGEFCGPKIQKNFYEFSERKFLVFDIAIDEQWMPWDDVVAIVTELKLELVPVDYSGAFDLEKIESLVARRSQLGADFPREGVVVKLRREGTRADGTRAIFKHKPPQKQERLSHRGRLQLTAEQIAFNSLRDAVTEYITAERVLHAIAHLREANQAIEFPTVVRELQQDILKEADANHKREFLDREPEFRRMVNKFVGKSSECKHIIFAAIRE